MTLPQINYHGQGVPTIEGWILSKDIEVSRLANPDQSDQEFGRF